MKSAGGRPFVYEKNQLIEVICQLRFPAILSIETKTPADFQDTVRERFPQYACQTETLTAAPDGTRSTQKNHSFVSAEGDFKISLTKGFIAFSTVRYRGWEQFAGMMDEPLGQFIRIYRPAYFERVGLRYLNGISRKALDLEDRRWNDLLQPQYLSILDDDAVDEGTVTKGSVDVERHLDERCDLRIHAGPGSIRRAVRTEQGVQTVQEQEVRFILDLDVNAGGKLPLAETAELMERLHGHSDRLFSDAITDALHDAMEPVEL